MCIGSDRVTGDCLGPYVGYRLSQHQLPGIFVYGTLSQPVHAVKSVRYNGLYFKEPSVCPVIAIDASLGDERHLGYVTNTETVLFTQVRLFRKICRLWGSIYITGIVNIAGILEYLTLQTTRLSTVITLADTIAQGILGNFI